MIGLILIYFIGKSFYELAIEHDKSKWGFAFLGVFSYYLGTFIFGVLLAIGMDLWSGTSVENINDFLLSIMALPFGILSCLGLYHLLKNSWKKNKYEDNNLLDELGN